ncbi:Putative lipid phosphate phosphatase 3, chloroplastic [Tolypocladium paradoxum]|uniref:Lipid phosphate phosphatase 3, chloroplastic n=1 Tax=Tolypocladium paradoxum TaxID=94208 RepID=A0A2S4KN56_9HYPO|nr:Putative lipid phosphate phosphatase 3, chloroplastic [Tolypocladium paradoxum]
MPSYQKMAHSGSSPLRRRFSLRLFASYALDWFVLVIVVVAAGFLGHIEPNKRPFSLSDPNISFPYTVKDTVPTWLLVVLCGLVPAVAIVIVSVLLVPGATVPSNTPHALVWKRKLWELHVGWLGLLMAVGSAFFFISGIKNMCGKPRPDLLSRCDPDLANAARYQVGGFKGEAAAALLYSGAICRQKDRSILDDGFRSYPSGHAAASAAGLIYFSLYLASKFAVTIPFVVPGPGIFSDASMHVAFPSRAQPGGSDPYEPTRHEYSVPSSPLKAKAAADRAAQHNSKIQSLRRQAAAPPLYLLAITLVPFCLAIFISASRWFDFRHHGFDILFGFLIGTATAIYSFRYYHLPIMAGAGWAWGPRSEDRAFWAGVGRLGYVGDRSDFDARVDRADLGESGDVDLHPAHGPAPGGMTQRGGIQYMTGPQQGGPPQAGPFQDVELERMEHARRPIAQGM